MCVEARVVEEVDRRPAGPRADGVRLELRVEVLRAVDVPEVPLVLVVLARAGEPERVVAADGVTDDLDERLQVDGEELRVETGLRVHAAHQRAGGGRVEPALHPGLQLATVKGQEVRALPASHVDDLDVLALLDLVRERGCPVDLEVEARLGQGLRKGRLELVRAPRPADLELQVGRRDPALDHRGALGGADHHDGGAIGPERLLPAGRRGGSEQHRRRGVRRVEPTRREALDHVARPRHDATERASGAPWPGRRRHWHRWRRSPRARPVRARSPRPAGLHRRRGR